MSIEAIGRAFQVIEKLAAAGGALPLGAISAGVDLPKPTVYRILSSLKDLGYVAQDESSGDYLTTARLSALGRGSEHADLKRRALPTMEALHRRFDETVNLGVLDGPFIYYAHYLETTQSLRLMVRPDARDPFHTTALGRAIVAHLPLAERDVLVAKAELEPRTHRTVRTKAALARILDETAARGWAIDDEENDVGVTCFGAPLLENGRPLAAISITLPTSRLTTARRREIIAALSEVRDHALQPH